MKNGSTHYVVIVQSIVDYQDGLTIACISHSLAGALEIFQKELSSAKADARANGYDVEEMAEGNNGERNFSTYLDGFYSSDHINVSLIPMQSDDRQYCDLL